MSPRLLAVLVVCLLSTGCVRSGLHTEVPSSQSAPPPTAKPTPGRNPAYAIGLSPPWKHVLESASLQSATEYVIDLSIDADLRSFSGHEVVSVLNSEAVSLPELRFRLFPNILGGEMTVRSARVGGMAVTPILELQNSVLIVPISPPLEPGQVAQIDLDFTGLVTEELTLNYGVQAYAEGVLTLAHAYPILEVYDASGWNAEIPPPSGDLVYADASLYNVRIEVPAGLTVVATGSEISRSTVGDRQTISFAAAPARDFFVGASGRYASRERRAGEVSIRIYAPEEEIAGALLALDYAQAALQYFSGRFGAYPYRELELLATPTLALGIEYPGVIALAGRLLDPDNPRLEGTVVHEVAHQWFYNLVGNDQLDEPWLDESFAQYATLEYFRDTYGEIGDRGFRSSLEGRWASVGSAEIPINRPVSGYTDDEYGAIVYGRGALFLDALREQMGNDAFDRFLATYIQELSWGIATTTDFKRIAETACTCQLDGTFDAWLE